MDSSSTEITPEDSECNPESHSTREETLDPDYLPAFGEKNSQTSLKLHQQDAKENAVKKIKNIVRNQFALEMQIKEQEIETIDSNIRQTKVALDRIRACVLARYYGMSEVYPSSHSATKPNRRSRREVGQFQNRRSAAKNRISSASSSAISGSSLNVLKQNHQFPSKDEKIVELPKFNNANSFTVNFASCTTSEIQNPRTLLHSDNTDDCPQSSQIKHSNSVNLLPGNFTGSQRTQEQNESLNCKKLLESNQELNIYPAKSSNCLNSIESYTDVNQTTKNIAVEKNVLPSHSSGICNQSSAAVNHLSASVSLTDTKVKVIGPQQSNLQMRDLGQKQMNEPGPSKLSSPNIKQTDTCGSGSRFYVKKRVIIGNTSKYIPPDRREDNDKSTHKWMVYVRGPPQDPNIDAYIKKVWFFLHPSYRPNDIVEINKPPFHLTRRGWGEFPIRVQLHFVGSWNKRVDIIHELKLDKTYTGLQTLGAETVVDLEIDRKTFEDLGIPVPMDTQAIQDQGLFDSRVKLSSNQSDVSKLKQDCSLDGSTDNKDEESASNFQVKKIKLETSSSTRSSPSISRLGSRCTSPVQSSNQTSKEFRANDDLQKQLHILSEKIPLIRPQKDLIRPQKYLIKPQKDLIKPQKDAKFPFHATSVNQFFEWNVGKQRAAEWQRALRIRNQLQQTCNSNKITTKEIMIWCRRNGYTPQSDLNLEACYCKVCGRLLNDDKCVDSVKLGFCPGKQCSELPASSSTLSPALELLAHVEERDRVLECNQNAEDEDVEVDIDGLPVSKRTTYIPSNQQTNLLTTPLTLEQQWVKDVCNEIGVGVRPEILEGVEVNSVDSMLLSVTKQFMKELIHTAIALSNDTKSSLDCKLLVPKHFNQAIKHMPHCDFLTNSYFGVDETKQQSE